MYEQLISEARLEELCNAERDGRCVVLPMCGDKLFYYPYPDEPHTLRNTGDGSGIVEAVRVQVRFNNWSGWIPLSKTTAEAEAKLKEDEH